MAKHVVYRITNLVNDRYYIGKHKTDIIDDGYMGSGHLIKQAIKKYGISNFKKEILYVFETAEEASLKERELVNPEDIKCYNLMNGGTGGWEYVHQNYQHSWIGRKHTEEYKEMMRNLNIGENNPMFGKTLSSETKEKMKNAWTPDRRKAQGEKFKEFARRPKSEETKAKMRAAALKRHGKIDG